MKSKNEVGAVFAELAIAIPIFAAFIFFIFWLFVALSQRDGIVVAVYNAVDLAQTRGNEYLLGLASENELMAGTVDAMIPKLDEYWRTGTWDGAVLGSQTNAGLLASGTTSENPRDFYNGYMSLQGWSGTAPKETWYAMAFAYAYLRRVLPPTVRFPCNPDLDVNGHGPGCLVCAAASPADMLHGGSATFPVDRFGIECRYRPAQTLLQPIMNLLGVTGPQFVFSHARSSVDESFSPLAEP